MATSRDAARAGQMTLLDEDPHLRREADFYQTYVWQTEALLRRVHLDPGWKYVEPCAGELAIVDRLRARGLTVWANDLVQRTRPLDTIEDATDEMSWSKFAFVRPIDVVITNVPFALAFPIVTLALEYAQKAVITLLRRTWDEPTEERDEWLAAHPCSAQIVMPRANYRGEGSGDSATHAWFIWAKEPGIVRQPHDVVTRRERDALIALYGDGHRTRGVHNGRR